MSIKAMRWAYGLFEVIEVPPAERSVLLVLCWFHKEKSGDCSPSQTKIAKLTGYRRQRVSEAVGWLEKSGLIKRGKERRVGKFDSCVYQIFGSFKGVPVSATGDTAKHFTVSKKKDTATVCARGDTVRGNTTKGDGETCSVIEFPSQKGVA